MELIINDTNILIDLANMGLASYCRAMQITFHTTDAVIFDVRKSRQFEAIAPLLSSCTLVENHFVGDANIQFGLFCMQYHTFARLTPADCSVMMLAEQKKCRLLTSDPKLLAHARQRGIETSDLLWLTDRMVTDGIVPPLKMIDCLNELLRTNTKVSRELIIERIDAYIRDNYKHLITTNNIEL